MVGKRSKKDSGKILTPEACNNVPLLENVSCLSATMELSEDYTASLSHGGTHIGIPDSLVKVFLSRSIQKRGTYTEYEARQFSSGCQDNFAIFAFLAFLLTVLDLVLEMQARKLQWMTVQTAFVETICQHFLSYLSTTNNLIVRAGNPLWSPGLAK